MNFSRQSKNIIPLGWTPVKKEGGELQYRCPFYQKTLTGEIRRCSVTCRRYRIKDHKIHKFDIPQIEDDIMNKNCLHRYEILTMQKAQETINYTTAKLAARLNISAKSSTSTAMNEHNLRLIQLGMDISSNIQKKQINLEKTFSICSDKTLALIMKKLANSQKENDFMEMQDIHYVNIAADSGTVSSTHCIHFLLTNPYYINMPKLLNIVVNNNNDSQKYGELFLMQVEEIFSHDLVITSIIIDHLRCQFNGIQNAIQTSEDPRIQAIVYTKIFTTSQCITHKH